PSRGSAGRTEPNDTELRPARQCNAAPYERTDGGADDKRSWSHGTDIDELDRSRAREEPQAPRAPDPGAGEPVAARGIPRDGATKRSGSGRGDATGRIC